MRWRDYICILHYPRVRIRVRVRAEMLSHDVVGIAWWCYYAMVVVVLPPLTAVYFNPSCLCWSGLLLCLVAPGGATTMHSGAIRL